MGRTSPNSCPGVSRTVAVACATRTYCGWVGSSRSEPPHDPTRRKLGLPLALALLVLCLAPRAPAQEPLTELWSEYPLYQPDEQPAAQAAEPEGRSAQESETPPAPEPEAPVPGGQQRSGEGNSEAIGPTADGPETLPWMLTAALTRAASCSPS
jgi:hypothetical protein